MARAIDKDKLITSMAWHDQQGMISSIGDVLDIIEAFPTLTQPNEALTLEELRGMDGEPVWFDTIKRWGIVRVCGYEISVLTKSGEYDVTRMKFYRRPPEGEL